MSKTFKININGCFGLLAWLGGAFYVAHQPGMNGWDGVVWFWYVGRFIAAHFTMLSY